jgi:hypothetical protein
MHIVARQRRHALILCLVSMIVVACASDVPSDSGCRNLVLRLRVHRDDTAPFTENFSSSFIDSRANVDDAGNSVRTGPSADSPVYKAGRDRSEYYTCVFRYSRSSEGVRNFAKIGTRPEDFRLLITNPAREDGQPRRIAIQLG